MYPKIKSDLVEEMSENPYALAYDGSSHCDPSEMNPVCVYIFDVKRSKQVESKFYSMCWTSSEDCSRAETLFTAISDAFKSIIKNIIFLRPLMMLFKQYMPSRCSSILWGIFRICPYKDGYDRVIIGSCLLGWFFQQGKLILVNGFSSILQFDKHEMNLLCEQFVDFQTISEEELPNGALADVIMKEFEDEDG